LIIMANFVRSTRGALVNLDHVAVLKPLARERGKGEPAHYTCLAWDGTLLGTVAAAEIAAWIGRAPEQPAAEPELFVIPNRGLRS
jgi:hypothetical protein